MLVSELYKVLSDYEDVVIICRDDLSQKVWKGGVVSLPSEFMDHEVVMIVSTQLSHNGTGLMITIK